MTALVLAAALGAAGLLTWLHLRPSGTRSAEEVPSLQHLLGPSPRRRRLPPLEERLPFSLRLAVLLLTVLGVWSARSGCAPDLRPVVVVDPGSPSEVWDRARSLPGSAAVLGFDGEQPRLLGRVDPRTAAALRDCSDTRAACLLRAADRSGRPLLLVGAFSSAEWRAALSRPSRAFTFVWTGPVPPATAGEAAASRTPLARIRGEGRSPAAQLWTAALATAAEASAGPPSPDPPPEVAVVDPEPGIGPRPGAAVTVVAVEAPSPAGTAQPAAEASPGDGVLLPDPLDLGAGTAGLGLRTSLRLLTDPRFTPLLPFAAIHRGSEGALLALAATPDDLGAWAHQGLLVPLARALLAGVLPPPTEIFTPGAGGPLGWRDAAGQLAPVGLLDVGPGLYRRSDGRVDLHQARARDEGTEPLDPAGLERLGGQPWSGTPAPRAHGVTALFAGAGLLWLAGVWLTRRVRRAWLPAAAVAILLALLAADATWPAEVIARWEAVLALAPGPAAANLEAQAQRAGVAATLRPDASPPPCAAPRAAPACTLLATVGLAAAPPHAADALVFDAGLPRVDLLSVDAPREIPLGAAAELWVTLRVRRGAGRTVAVTARATAAAPAAADVEVHGVDVVRRVRLEVSPLSEGIGFVAVEAAIVGEPQAQDGRLVALAARARTPRRMVLAAAPGWEARAAAEALETAGPGVELLTLLGARAVVSQGRAGEDPRRLLADAGGLAGVDLLVLVGFSARDLDGPAAAGLRRFVEAGGSALVLDAPGAAAALGVKAEALAAVTPLRPLVGRLEPVDPIAFRGYGPPADLHTPVGAVVLGRLGGRDDAATLPWVVGRAVGKGRVAVVTAPDLWRVSAPGQGRQAYRNLVLRLLGWLEAPSAARRGAVLADDWGSLQVETGSGVRSLPLPTPGPVEGLAVDPVDLAGFIRSPRARLRAEAARVRHPFLEPDGADALGAAWRRLPPAPRWSTQVPLRVSDAAFGALAALLVLEALARRLYRAAGSGTRVSTAPSSGDTGGTTTGDGRSQRASATPAARAAALRDGPSSAA